MQLNQFNFNGNTLFSFIMGNCKHSPKPPCGVEKYTFYADNVCNWHQTGQRNHTRIRRKKNGHIKTDKCM